MSHSLSSFRLWSVRALLAVVAVASVKTTHAQYYYQPSPSYYRNDTLQGGLLGGGVGALAGAAIGGKNNRGQGALIGGGVGLLSGALIGKAADNADEQRAAAGAAVVNQANVQNAQLAAQANAQAAAQAVTNQDLIEMTRGGLGEDVIIGTIRSRGGRFDTSPQSLIYLKQNGVSDRVVVAAQSAAAPAPLVAGAPAYAVPAAPTVYVAPAPVYYQPAPVIRVYGPGYYGGPYHHHHHGYHGW